MFFVGFFVVVIGLFVFVGYVVVVRRCVVSNGGFVLVFVGNFVGNVGFV